MKKRCQTQNAEEAVLILGTFIALTILGFGGYFLYNAVIQERSTYSIVAIDPVTGDVGAAGASCVPISASSLAALVPGQGAAAIQAAFIPKNQTEVFNLLSQGKTASEIIEQIGNDTYDSTLRFGNMAWSLYTEETSRLRDSPGMRLPLGPVTGKI